MGKNFLDFGELDPIFKVAGVSDYWKMACLNNMSVQTGGGHTFSFENTVLVSIIFMGC